MNLPKFSKPQARKILFGAQNLQDSGPCHGRHERKGVKVRSKYLRSTYILSFAALMMVLGVVVDISISCGLFLSRVEFPTLQRTNLCIVSQLPPSCERGSLVSCMSCPRIFNSYYLGTSNCKVSGYHQSRSIPDQHHQQTHHKNSDAESIPNGTIIKLSFCHG